MDVAFRFDRVTVSDGGRTRLAEVTAEVPVGGITVLTGPSGAGKSTMLRLCNRLLVPTSGTVSFHGDDVAALDPLALRRRVGMVFQAPTPFPGTVADNLRTADPELADRDCVELLASAALDADLLGRDARELSGGEQQRMCLARTLATRPEVLLVDEGTSALDAAATAVLEGLVRGVADDGHTVLWVTHDAGQAARLAEHRIELPTPGDAGGS